MTFDPNILNIGKWKLFDLLGYQPHEKQMGFHLSTARYRIAAAGTRFGKSLMAAMEVCPMLLKPKTQGWIVGPTYRLGEKEFRYVWESLIIKLNCPTVRANNNVELGDMYIEFPWGSWVRVMTAEKPKNLLGEELDFLVLGEASQIKKQTFTRYLRGRIVTREGWVVANTTPNEQEDLIYPMFLKGQDPRFSDYWSAQYGTADNPLIPLEEIEAARADMPVDEFAEQYMGEFMVLGARSVFDSEILHDHLKNSPDPILVGNVLACLAGSDEASVRLEWEIEEDDEGCLEVYEHYDSTCQYALGGDVAEENTPHGDFSCADVVNCNTGNQAAHWHGSISPHEFAYVCGALGYAYGTAAIGVEHNNMGAATNHELKKFYPKLYRRKILDQKGAKDKKTSRIGWYTSAKSKPVMIKDLSKAIESGELTPNSPATIREMLSFGKNKDGKLGALGASHDDRVISLAIAEQVGQQFSYDPSIDDNLDYLYQQQVAGYGVRT